MNAWICDGCGAMNKEMEKPASCLFCKRKSTFTQIEFSENKDESSLKYEEALKKLENYEEGVPKRKLSDYSCGCSKKD